MSKDRYLESGEITAKVLLEGLDDFGIKHPNFEGPSPKSRLSVTLFLFINRLHFPRVV